MELGEWFGGWKNENLDNRGSDGRVSTVFLVYETAYHPKVQSLCIVK